MKRKVSPWAIFIVCFLLLGLGATRFGKTADLTLISVRFTAVIVLSVLLVHETWKQLGWENYDRSELNQTLLQRCRRWYHGEA